MGRNGNEKIGGIIKGNERRKWVRTKKTKDDIKKGNKKKLDIKKRTREI